jgi:hypothetical protein
MANQAVRLYDHQKQSDGKWKFIPVDFEITPAKTAQPLCYKLGIKGRLRRRNFKLSWYEGPAKKFEPGSYPSPATTPEKGAMRTHPGDDHKADGLRHERFTI